jgi:hypothetical protein
MLSHRGSTSGKAMGQNGSALLRSYGLIHIYLNGMTIDFYYLRLRDYFCCGLSGMTLGEYREKNKAGLQGSSECHISHCVDHNPKQKT